MDEVPTPTMPEQPSFVRRMWSQYGLIVVGNVVFFILLYFVSYRPHNESSRAGEFLSMAQRQESDGQLQAAEVLYEKVLLDYAETAAAGTARDRLPKVQAGLKRASERQLPLPAACAPTIQIEDLLEQRPSFYVAELLGAFYPEVQPAERARYFDVLDGYVWQAFNRDGVAFDKLAKSPSFRDGGLQKRYFKPKLEASFEGDYYYDDFRVKNAGFFPLHNVVIEFQVKQAGDSTRVSVRAAELAADASLEMLEFRVREDGGSVEIAGSLVSDEGKHSWTQRL